MPIAPDDGRRARAVGQRSSRRPRRRATASTTRPRSTGSRPRSDGRCWPTRAAAPASKARRPSRTRTRCCASTNGRRQHQPEVVLRVGDPWASKVVTQWLAATPELVIVDRHGVWIEPDRRPTLRVHATASMLAATLAPLVSPVDEQWLQSWTRAERSAEQAVSGELGNGAPLSEPLIANIGGRTFARLFRGGGRLVDAGTRHRMVRRAARPRHALRQPWGQRHRRCRVDRDRRGARPAGVSSRSSATSRSCTIRRR